jgi:hypothetical protein
VMLTACGGSGSSSSTRSAGGGSSASTTSAGNGGSSSGSFDDLSGLAPCLKSAGATLLTAPAQLAFALPAIPGDVEVDVAGQLRDGSVTRSYKQSSGKNGGWVIYVGGPKGSEPPGLGDLTTKRLGAGQVAGFVRPADPAVVKKADDCLDGDVDS